MNDIVFEVLKVIVMLAALLVTRYIVPWIKAKIGTEQLEEVKTWVNAAVLMAQQVHGAKPGEERKQIVLDLVQRMLAEKKIYITAEELDTLIEAAVKAMKMQEA